MYAISKRKVNICYIYAIQSVLHAAKLRNGLTIIMKNTHSEI